MFNLSEVTNAAKASFPVPTEDHSAEVMASSVANQDSEDTLVTMFEPIEFLRKRKRLRTAAVTG